VINFDDLLLALTQNELAPWVENFRASIGHVVEQGHGDLFRWQHVLNELPERQPSAIDLAKPAPLIGLPDDLSPAERDSLEHHLRQLHPWRKGPFELFGISIDSEWRSDMKWARLADKISPLRDRLVLDVGGGNGYYALRMIGAGAKFVLSVDPTWLFVVQFKAISRYLNNVAAHVAPIGIEHLPPNMQMFDTVFSMGVLYHRRSPIQHLLELHAALKPGGQLVLETLIIDDEQERVLVPAERYAKMRNVWFIASPSTLLSWLEKTGFVGAEIIDQSRTTTEEQRKTAWMRFESLSDYLNPSNPDLTVEGLPAPRRAILTAQKAE